MADPPAGPGPLAPPPGAVACLDPGALARPQRLRAVVSHLTSPTSAPAGPAAAEPPNAASLRVAGRKPTNSLGPGAGRPVSLALQLHRIPTHFLLNLHGI
jgi:hypothetical protein